MKKYLVGLVASAAAVFGSTAATAQTVVANSGPYEIAMLDDGQTCVLGGAADTGQFLMISYSAKADSLKIMVSAPNVGFAQDGEYDIGVVVDGTTYKWVGTGIRKGDTSAVLMTAGNSADTYKGLVAATTVQFTAPSGRTIVAFASDKDFDEGMKLTALCALALAEQ